MEECENRRVLQNLSNAWGRKDIEGILGCFAANAVYRASAGPEPGEQATGHADIRKLIRRMFSFDDGSHATVEKPYCFGNAAVWRWQYDLPDGSKELGCDIFEFQNGKITLKDAYRKIKIAELK